MRDYSSLKRKELLSILQERDLEIGRLRSQAYHHVFEKLVTEYELEKSQRINYEEIIKKLHLLLNKYKLLVGDLSPTDFYKSVDN